MNWSPLLWLVFALIILGLELNGADFGFLPIALASALLMSISTSILLINPVLQFILYLLLFIIGFTWIRRWSSKRSTESDQMNEQDLLAIALVPIKPNGNGRVRWHGQNWGAISLDPEITISAEEKVIVLRREGNRLEIMPQSK